MRRMLPNSSRGRSKRTSAGPEASDLFSSSFTLLGAPPSFPSSFPAAPAAAAAAPSLLVPLHVGTSPSPSFTASFLSSSPAPSSSFFGSAPPSCCCPPSSCSSSSSSSSPSSSRRTIGCQASDSSSVRTRLAGGARDGNGRPLLRHSAYCFSLFSI